MRRPAGLLVLAALAMIGAGLLGSTDAQARVEADSHYSKTQTFNAALRYLRVDLGFKVLEKDADAGYVLFNYVPPGDPKDASKGSIEVIKTRNDVKVFVQLPKMPRYHEVVLRDGLMKKLREEYGDPPPPKRPAPPAKPKGDAGTDAG